MPKLHVSGEGEVTRVAKLLMRVIPPMREYEDISIVEEDAKFARRVIYVKSMRSS
jgi:hypothetical protein